MKINILTEMILIYPDDSCQENFKNFKFSLFPCQALQLDQVEILKIDMQVYVEDLFLD